MHPLGGATARINRARKHLAELKGLVDGFQQARHDAVLIKFEEEAPYKLKLVHPFPPPFVPEDISILVGEICYNLRAALDYLIFELTRLDSGVSQQFTQFPIEDRKKSFDRSVETRLKGLNARHIALIEMLQPYRGCDWAATLKVLSNPDKHRILTPTFYVGIVTIGRVGENFPEVPQISTVHRARRPDGIEMDVQLVTSTSIQIFVKNGNAPVVETLEILQSQVAEAIDAFKAEF